MCLLSFGSDENLRDPLLLRSSSPSTLPYPTSGQTRFRNDPVKFSFDPGRGIERDILALFLFFSFFSLFSLSLFFPPFSKRGWWWLTGTSLSPLSIQFHEPFSIVRPSSTTSSTYARLILYFSIDSVHCSYQGRGWPPWKGRDELAGAGEARRANVINYPGNDSDWWAAGQVQPASK